MLCMMKKEEGRTEGWRVEKVGRGVNVILKRGDRMRCWCEVNVCSKGRNKNVYDMVDSEIQMHNVSVHDSV